MSSLFGSLSIALQSLLVQQAAVGTTTNNIANSNTTGYARQRALLQEEVSVLSGTTVVPQGVSLAKVESIRDQILELRLHQETQQDGHLQAYVDAVEQIETLFNETQDAGLGSTLSAFFDSFEALTADPTSVSLRQAVITAGENLASAFRAVATNLTQLQRSLDQNVTSYVEEVNSLTAQIADLNQQIAAVEGTGQEAGELVDQRTQAIRELAGLVDISVISADDSISISTSKGTALVVGTQSFSLETHTDTATGFQHIFAQGTDITSTLTAGKIGGTLEARDLAIPSYLADLDNLAAQLRNSINTAHRAGYDLSGEAGQDFFVPFTASDGSNAGAASSFAMAISDPSEVAASSDGTSGDNGNLTVLTDVADQLIVDGQRPVDFYANLVARIGNDVSDASAELEAEELVLQQLENQRAAVSGVSLDEEAANLIRYQRAYEAAARVVSTVNQLLDTAINLGAD